MNKTIAKKISLLILMYLWGTLGYAEEKGKIVKYDILSNGDSVSWRTWFHDTYGITFLKEIPQ